MRQTPENNITERSAVLFHSSFRLSESQRAQIPKLGYPLASPSKSRRPSTSISQHRLYRPLSEIHLYTDVHTQWLSTLTSFVVSVHELHRSISLSTNHHPSSNLSPPITMGKIHHATSSLPIQVIQFQRPSRQLAHNSRLRKL